MALEGPPEPQTPRSDRRKFYDMVADGVLAKAVDRVAGKLSAKLLEAFKHGRSEGRREGAAVAFGLMLMAFAIRNHPNRYTIRRPIVLIDEDQEREAASQRHSEGTDGG